MNAPITTNDHGNPKHLDISLRRAEDLDTHLKELIAVDEEKGHLVFSAFLDLSDTNGIPNQLRLQVRRLETGLDSSAASDLYEAESAILNLIGNGLNSAYQGLACHFRGGPKSFMKAIAFHVPLKPSVIADSLPLIVPLIELRDSYDRYVVLISTESQARILEIVLGSVTREAWLKRPELRKRVGREWTRNHYQNHQRDRDRQFIREKVSKIKELMVQKGHTHLILAGNPQRISMIEKELPEPLRKRIVDICRLGLRDPREKVVAETIEAFIQQEAYESQVNLERLREGILRGSGAVVGLDQCEGALEAGVVDTLIVASSDENSLSRHVVFRHRNRDGGYVTLHKRLEQLLQRAVGLQTPIEFVPRGSFLDDYSGCGAILRYRGAEHAIVK